MYGSYTLFELTAFSCEVVFPATFGNFLVYYETSCSFGRRWKIIIVYSKNVSAICNYFPCKKRLSAPVDCKFFNSGVKGGRVGFSSNFENKQVKKGFRHFLKIFEQKSGFREFPRSASAYEPFILEQRWPNVFRSGNPCAPSFTTTGSLGRANGKVPENEMSHH